MQRFKVIIEGPNWEDLDEIELAGPPSEGEPLDTKYGTCTVTRVDLMPDSDQYAASIRCRLP